VVEVIYPEKKLSFSRIWT